MALINCSECGKKVSNKATSCPNCGNPIGSEVIDNKKEQHQEIVVPEKIRCPKCKSTNISSGKKGFSGQKAVGGAIITGGIGVLAGTIGSNKVQLWCLSCGNKFKPGEDLQGLRNKKKQQEEMNAWMDDVPGCMIFVWIVSILGVLGFISMFFY